MTEHAPRTRVQSLDRAARLLETVADGDSDGVGLADIAESLGVARSTAHAMLRTLEANALVAEVPGPRFVLGTGLIRLGDIATKQRPIADVARPILAGLARETGLTTRLAVADGGYPIFVARVDGPGVVRFHTPLGGREAPNASAAGKVVLADLPDDQVRELLGTADLPRRTARTITDVDALLRELEVVRTRGYAIDDEEDVEGTFCVAVGVRNSTGRVVGAISTTGITSDRRTRSIAELGETISKYAGELGGVIGR